MPVSKQIMVGRRRSAPDGIGIDKITFGLGLPGPVPLIDDQGLHAVCLSGGFLLAAFAIATFPPLLTGDALFIDIRRSSDMGATWTSIFPSATGAQLQIPQGITTRRSQFVFDVIPTEVFVGDWWRVDVLNTSAPDAAQVFVVLVWQVTSVDDTLDAILALPPF